MTEEQLNPIQQRLQKLEGFWNDFAAADQPRILRWLVDDDSRQMVQLFSDLQSEPVSQIPDLFVELKSPFNSTTTWSTELLQEFCQLYETNRSDIEATGIPMGWIPPESIREDVSTTELVRVLDSFHAACEMLAERLAIVLAPSAVVNPGGWATWLENLATCQIPPQLRFVVTDSSLHPVLADVAERFPEVICTIDPQLRMPEAYEEIVGEVAGDSPGHDFRRYFVALTNAAGRGDTAAAESAAAKAIRIATAQNWGYLVSTAQMALGAAWFTASNLDSALGCYRAAFLAVADAEDEAGRKLVVPTRMAEASTLVAASRFAEAAAVYEAAAVAAAEQQDPSAELECWRMAGWCLENEGLHERSWECGEKSIAAAEHLTEEQRQMTCLPYVGQMLQRLARTTRDPQRAQRAEEQMTALLGRDWAELIAAGGAS